MAFLKKINESWQPLEKPGLAVGEIIDFPASYEALVRGGMAILVDKDGNELELPGQMFDCPVCFKKIEGLKGFTDHVSKHLPKPKEEKTVTEVKTEGKAVTATEAKENDIRAKRLAALEKAREARAKKAK